MNFEILSENCRNAIYAILWKYFDNRFRLANETPFCLSESHNLKYRLKPHSDLFISKYSLAHMCSTCIMHCPRCRILATIGTEYKHGPLSPIWSLHMPIFQRGVLWIFYGAAKPVILSRTLWTLAHQISASLLHYFTIGRSYYTLAYAIDSHLMFRAIILLVKISL